MKKIALHILLFTYTSVLLQPLLPYIADATAHVLWYSHHMATVHYENGKYHVHNETIAMAKKTNTENNGTGDLKKQVNENDHLVYKITVAVSTFSMLQHHCLPRSISPQGGYPQCNYPPPKFNC